MGHAVGVGGVAHGQIADGDNAVGILHGAGNAAALGVDTDAVQRGEGQLHLRRGRIVRLLVSHGVLQGDVFVAVRILYHRELDRLALHLGQTDGHQLVADLRVAVRVHAGVHKAVDGVAFTVHQIAVRAETEVAHAGELQGLEAVGVRAVDGRGSGLVAHQEEAVAIEHTVHGVAGRIVARGHIQIDAGHLRAVADLRGVLTAGGGGTIRAAAVHGVQRVTENRALGFIAVCIDVGDVVAHHIQLAHVAFQARDRRIHCSGHLFC